MPSKTTSPFASTFKTAVKRGTPCSLAVNNIASRTNKTPSFVFQSLYKAGLCFRQKVGGQWVYWAVDGKKGNSKNTKVCQNNMWQCFVDWCICSGCCTPNQMHNHCGSQNDFMNFCKKFWGKQFTGSSTTKKGMSKSTKGKSKGKSTKSKMKNKGKGTSFSSTKSYKFPTVGKTRKYRKVA